MARLDGCLSTTHHRTDADPRRGEARTRTPSPSPKGPDNVGTAHGYGPVSRVHGGQLAYHRRAPWCPSPPSLTLPRCAPRLHGLASAVWSAAPRSPSWLLVHWSTGLRHGRWDTAAAVIKGGRANRCPNAAPVGAGGAESAAKDARRSGGPVAALARYDSWLS